MTRVTAAAGSERLPWIYDDPKPATRQGGRQRALPMAAGAALLVAVVGASYWLGVSNGDRTDAPPMTKGPSVGGAMTKPPQPQSAHAEVPLPAAPDVEPAAQPQVRIAEPSPGTVRAVSVPPSTRSKVKEESSRDRAASAPAIAIPAPARIAPLASAKDLTLWPATRSQGAAGRIVRIGAFGTRQQAKLGWRRMVQAYPGVAPLPATVVSDLNSRGRTFYRFQIGTTSQAHSEVLCQRMRSIHFSCAVIGLSWKPEGVER